MKSVIVALLLVALAAAQQPLPENPQPQPAPVPTSAKPVIIHRVKGEHDTRNRVLWIVVGVAVAGSLVYIFKRDPSCHEYPPGQNGVGFPCPKDSK